MDIDELESLLHNALKSNMAVMSNRDTQVAVENVLIALNNIQGLIHGLNADNLMDNYKFLMSGKAAELAMVFVNSAIQRLNERGVNLMGGAGFVQPMPQMYPQPMPQMYPQPMPQMMRPMPPTQPVYQPQMPRPMMPAQPMPQPRPQPMPQPRPMAPQAPMPASAPAPQPAPAPAPQPASAPQPAPAPVPSAPKKSSLDEPLVARDAGAEDDSGDDDFALPGTGADKAAPGRDYLLSILKK